MPSFTELLRAVTEAWQNRRDQLLASGRQLVSLIAQQQGIEQGASEEPLNPRSRGAKRAVPPSARAPAPPA